MRQSVLGVLQQEGWLDTWDDHRIGTGEDWYGAIQQAIEQASVAILLISADFLTSQFILHDEVPRLLERRKREGLVIVPVIARPCNWQLVSWLRGIESHPKDGRALSAGNGHQIDTDLAAIAEEVLDIVEKSRAVGMSDTPAPATPPVVSLARLPSTNPELFGREAELARLDAAWNRTQCNSAMVARMGYHRRDAESEDLQQHLAHS